MNEIRFNQPVRSNNFFPGAEKEESNHIKKPRDFRFFKKLLKLILILAIATLVIFALKKSSPSLAGIFGSQGDAYSAVFLANGQVYFGKMTKNSDKEIVLNNVYYLQVGEAATTLNQNSFKLVKLGDELHGPTDELFINKANVIFYEYLRDDSKVVESIKKL